MVRSLKNSFLPISRIPPEVLSLIPDYCEEEYVDRASITLTHVCRRWREAFISRSTLWTHLDCMDVDKTRTYIQRSKSSPLRIFIFDTWGKRCPNHAFSLVIPHISRIRSLMILAGAIPDLLRHFCCHPPLLEELDINITLLPTLTIDNAMFGGDLSPLRRLTLIGVVTHLPWRNMAKLTVFKLHCPLMYEVAVTRILDFFESVPLLNTVDVTNSIPDSSDAPPGRTVSLRHLKTLSIATGPVHSILSHLRIPIGASLRVWTTFGSQTSPLLSYLPETSFNILSLSHIAAVDLCFHLEDKCVQLSGPSGSLRLFARWTNRRIPLSTMDHRILRSLGPRVCSTTQRLVILGYINRSPADTEGCPIFHTLSSMNNLRTLVLSQCYHRPFLFALDPGKNSSKQVLCPDLKEIVFYTASWGYAGSLIGMAKRRAVKGVKLLSIKMIGLGAPPMDANVVKLREYVTQVEYRGDTAPLS